MARHPRFRPPRLPSCVMSECAVDGVSAALPTLVVCDGSSVTPPAVVKNNVAPTTPDPAQGTGGRTRSHVQHDYEDVIIELCCSPQPEIGRQAGGSARVSRLTQTDDFRIPGGQNKVRCILDRFANVPTLVWVSFPCTGGSAWQEQNRRHGKSETRNTICAHWEVLRQLWCSFTHTVLPYMSRKNVHIAREWPSTCAYSKWHEGGKRRDVAPHIPFFDTMTCILTHG